MIINRVQQIAPETMLQSPIVLSNCRVFLDFDNTITTADVLYDIIGRFSINKEWVALEKAWQEEKIGTKECLEGQLKNIRLSKSSLHKFLKKVDLDPHFHQLLSFLVREGIKPVILSDNFTYIVEWILKNHGLKDLKVYGNALRFWKDHLFPSFPYDNPFCLKCAHCKKIHLIKDKSEDKMVVYIGDGRSDFCAAKVSDIVFAKDAFTLQHFMAREGLPFLAYKDLGDVLRYFQELSLNKRT